MGGGEAVPYVDAECKRLYDFYRICQLVTKLNPYDNQDPDLIPKEFMEDVNLYHPDSMCYYLKIMLNFVIDAIGKNTEDRWEKILRPITLARPHFNSFVEARIETTDAQWKIIQSTWSLLMLAERVYQLKLEIKRVDTIDFEEMSNLLALSRHHEDYRQHFPIIMYLFIIFKSLNVFHIAKFLLFLMQYCIDHNKRRLADRMEERITPKHPSNREYLLYYDMVMNDLTLHYCERLFEFAVGVRESYSEEEFKPLVELDKRSSEILFSKFDEKDYEFFSKVPSEVPDYETADWICRWIKRTIEDNQRLLSVDYRETLLSLNAKLAMAKHVSELELENTYRSLYFISYVYLNAGKFHTDIDQKYKFFKKSHTEFANFIKFYKNNKATIEYKLVELLYKAFSIHDEGLAQMWKLRYQQWKADPTPETQKKLLIAANTRINLSTVLTEFVEIFRLDKHLLWPLYFDCAKAYYLVHKKVVNARNLLVAVADLMIKNPMMRRDISKRCQVNFDRAEDSQAMVKLLFKHFDELRK